MQHFQRATYQAAAYLRLSKEDVDAKTAGQVQSGSIANQEQLILDYVKNQPDIQIVSMRVDDGYTGTNFDRPAFQMMMEDIKAGRINCVIVKDLSRFGREYISAGKYIDRLFPCYGVRLIAINDGIDTVTRNPGDDFHITIKNLINDNYCRDISVKIRSHLKIKRKNGEFLGAFAPYGYEKSPENRHQLIIDPYAAGVVQDIFRWKLEGMSQDTIAKRLTSQGVLSPMEYKQSQGLPYQTGFQRKTQSQWTPVAVRRILTNPVYLGTLTQGVRTRPNYKIKKTVKAPQEQWSINENCHDPIIEHRLFFLVQRLLTLDTRTSPGQKTVFPLSGLLECGDCHSPMVRKTTTTAGKSYTYYLCSANKNQKCCSSHRIPERELEDAVLTLIQEHIRLLIQLEQCVTSLEQAPFHQLRIKKIRERISHLETEQERYRRLKAFLYEDYKEGLLSHQDYLDIHGEYDEKISHITLALKQTIHDMDFTLQQDTHPHPWIREFLEHRNIQTLTRAVVVECLERVEVYEGKKIQVVFRHAQNYHQLLEQVREYHNQQNAKQEVG